LTERVVVDGIIHHLGSTLDAEKPLTAHVFETVVMVPQPSLV
jgi:hypothetical protein